MLLCLEHLVCEENIIWNIYMLKKLLIVLLFSLVFAAPTLADHDEKKECNCKHGETCSGDQCSCDGDCDCKDCQHKEEHKEDHKEDHKGHDHD